jgi:hypothetical protein
VTGQFQIILQCLHANNNAGALSRGNLNHDPAHKVRRIFDLINKVFKEKYPAARDLTVDESMVDIKVVTTLYRICQLKRLIVGVRNCGRLLSRTQATQRRELL